MGQPTAPAANTDWEYSVPAGKQGMLYLLGVKIVTGAAGSVQLHIEAGSNTTAAGPIAPFNASNFFGLQNANQTNTYVVAPGLPSNDGLNRAWRCAPMPRKNIVNFGVRMHCHTNPSNDFQQTPFWVYKETTI